MAQTLLSVLFQSPAVFPEAIGISKPGHRWLGLKSSITSEDSSITWTEVTGHFRRLLDSLGPKSSITSTDFSDD
ncbi:MAG TPA: hypothetical protein VGA84_07000 [Thermoanaerobaculia bacterium]